MKTPVIYGLKVALGNDLMESLNLFDSEAIIQSVVIVARPMKAVKVIVTSIPHSAAGDNLIKAIKNEYTLIKAEAEQCTTTQK